MKWILGSFRRDALFFMLPGFLAVALTHISFAGVAVAALAGILESGHIATTVWRTWLHESERQRSAYFWSIPLLAALGAFMWYRVGLPYLWSLVIFVTIFHYGLQCVRLAHWNEPQTSSQRFAWSLLLLPILAFHFRENVAPEFSSLVSPNKTAFGVCVALYALSVAAYAFYELRGAYQPARTRMIVSNSALFAFCFFFGRDLVSVLAPLMISHSISYLALNTKALRITRAKSLDRHAAVVISTTVAYGILTTLAVRIVGPRGNWTATLLTLYVVPSVCHMVYDVWLWSRTHWESRLVYGLSTKRGDLMALTSQKPPESTATDRAS